MTQQETRSVADNSGARKRIKEIKKEMATLKEKLAGLKAEREQLKASLAAEKPAAKPA
jgi:predicted nuclease with TOPRIM domain